MGKIFKLTRNHGNANITVQIMQKFLTIKLRVFKFYNIDSLITISPTNRIINFRNLLENNSSMSSKAMKFIPLTYCQVIYP